MGKYSDGKLIQVHVITTLNTTKLNKSRPIKIIVSTLLLITNYNQAHNNKIQKKLMIGKLQTNMRGTSDGLGQ